MTEETIFAGALERRDATARKEYLDAVCGDDPALRRRVEALLHSHESDAAFLQRPAFEQIQVCPPETDPVNNAGQKTLALPVDDEHSAVLRVLEPARRPGVLGRLKHYDILEIVGWGAFGTVLKAFDERLHRTVAVKILAPVLAGSATARQRFLREARAAAAVRHDNVIAIYAVEDEPVPFLVMELIDGPNLQAKLDRVGSLSAPQVLRIGSQMAAGLAAAHKLGLVHRDIKPSNILLENGVERVKITDFGLARAGDDTSLTHSGMVAGTPLYMSPEQALGQTLDGRSDLFSLGSVLYALCAGRPPFRGGTALAVLKCVCEETPPPVRDLNPEVPPRLAEDIARLLAKQPAQRFHSAAEVGDRLAQYLAELQGGGGRALVATPVVPPAQTRTCQPEAAPGADRRLPRPRWLLALGLVLLIGGACLIAVRPWAKPESKGNGDHLREPEPLVFHPGPPRTLPDPAELAGRATPADQIKEGDWYPTLRTALGSAPAPGAIELVAILGKGPFLHTEHGLNSELGCLAYDPTGKHLASANARFDPGTVTFAGWEVRLWEAATGRAVRIIGQHAAVVHALAFSPDGERLVTGARDGTVKVWETATGKELLELKGLPAIARGVVFSPDGKRIAAGCCSASGEGKSIVWNSSDGTHLATFLCGGNRGFLSVAFSPDGELVASVGEAGDGAVHVWESRTEKEVARLKGNTEAHRAAVFSADSKRLVAVGHHHVAQVWDLATQEVVSEFKGHAPGSAIIDVTRSRDGSRFATASTDGTLRVWNAETGQALGSYNLRAGGAACVAFHPDGKTLAGGGGFGQVHTFDLGTGAKIMPPQHAGQIEALAISPDGRQLASAGEDQTVRLWDLASGQWRQTLLGHRGRVPTVAFSPDSKTVASGGEDRAVRLWDSGTGAELHALAGHTEEVRQVIFAPDGALVASASLDGTVRLWDVPGGKLRHVCTGDVACRCAAFSPDGKWLASGREDGAIDLWDVHSGDRAATLHGSAGAVWRVAFHPDGRTLAAITSGALPALRLWDLATRTESQSLHGHAGPVRAGVWRADGGLLITCGGSDGTVRFWDVAARPPRHATLALFPPGLGPLPDIALTPEGRYLAAANFDGTISFLKLADRGTVFQASAPDR